MILRQCSKAGCSEPAVASLTYAYADSQAVLGPISLRAEPGAYDLCRTHADRITVPKDWELIRLPGEYAPAKPAKDDLMTLADAIRAVGLGQSRPPTVQPQVARRKGHLAVLADVD